jgi:N-acetylmuramoyl-L-alanine amidase
MLEYVDLTAQDPVQPKMTIKPSIIVMHYTVSDFQSTNNFFLKNQQQNEILAHYVINYDSNGTIYKYLDNDRIGKHAGISYWNGQTNINQYSVGIENVNYGFNDVDLGNGVKLDDGFFYYQFPDAQVKSIANLTSELINLYDIKPYNIVGHSDVAISFGRKEDPGPLFPWEKLAKEYGIGIWYNLSLMHEEFNYTKKILKNFTEQEKLSFFINKLIEFGYGSPELVPNVTIDQPYGIQNTNDINVVDTNAKFLIQSYNMHYRPDKGISSKIDEKDFEIINSLNMIKNITQNHNLSMEQLKNLYNNENLTCEYLESQNISCLKIDDTINFLLPQ